MSAETTEVPHVHVLDHGRVLCGFSDKLPGDWPEGHRWVGRTGLEEVNCEPCKDAARKLNQERDRAHLVPTART